MLVVILSFIALFVVILFFTLTARDRMLKTYKKFITVKNSKGIDGKTLAFFLRERLGLDNLKFARTDHNLADAYYIKAQTLVLSNDVADKDSLASLTIVAHEFGHAIQHRTDQAKFHFNYVMQKITRITNKLIFPLLIIGLILYFAKINSVAGLSCVYGGFALFLFNIVLKLSNIPIEYDASRRGLKLLQEYNILSPHELKNAKKLLKMAAQTYIAGFFDGILLFTGTISRLTDK